MYTIDDLKNVMQTLLSDNGCSWDRAQTHETLKQYLIEECYEAVEAINNKDMDNLCEELGDLLFQIIFHSELAQKEQKFNFDDVVDNVTKKMIYRHPHVFNKDDESQNIGWDKLKEKEKGYKTADDVINSVPKALPSLIRSQKIISKSIKYGKYSDTAENIADNISKYSDELKLQILRNNKVNQEIIGNILLELTKISHFFQINADFSLTNALEKFINRIEDYWYALKSVGEAIED